MQTLRRLFAKLRSGSTNPKSAGGAPIGPASFLGYSFWTPKKGEVKRRVVSKALAAMKQRVRLPHRDGAAAEAC